MKKNKIIIVLSAIIFALTMSLLTINVRADSGWDSDYDSGSDWDSSSSWDSDWGSSSWDSDYSSDNYNGTYSTSRGSAIAALIFIVCIVLIIIGLISTVKTNNATRETIVNRVPDEELKKILPDLNKEEFLNKAYQIFIDVQNAWMNFDYDSLRKLLTDELYNTYVSQLKALDALKQKNIMEDFNKIDIDISDYSYTDDKLTMKVELIVSFFDFVVNKNNQIMRGTNNRKLTNHYELTFICSRKKASNKCPNCGSPLENVASSTCPYCNSTIVSNNFDWVMSKKQIKR